MKNFKLGLGVFVMAVFVFLWTSVPSFAQQGRTSGDEEKAKPVITNNTQDSNGESTRRQSQFPTSQIDPDVVQKQADDQVQKQGNDTALQKRSQVANAVQAMLSVADRQQGIGQQIREIAQAQNQNQEQLEANMQVIKNRGRLRKFFFGPDYKSLNLVESNLNDMDEKISQLKELAATITNVTDAAKLQDQITALEQVKSDWAQEAQTASQGFSLFGWLNKIIFKK